ncbi:cbb3-type cytochrome c oxidase N-terminal domain-containing protein [Olivibacter sp. XZL3]|uniref:cbb3-type cytochrome c oxidase N-terminal domain-containing protein n=1 Tax=Olivibacter sp. XZL3 TaxID=1735116 RepID=UPI001064DE32|nr:cbb3-type cytochrome c oxidase N-terminal domain-containing protein [Olivibacter sp. XZL3]
MNNFLLRIDPVAAVENSLGSGNIHRDILIITLLVVALLVLVAAVVLHKAFKTLIRVTMPEIELSEAASAKARKAERRERLKMRWNKLMGLRPLAEEEDLLIDHAYDGIKELDNPTPVWFMGLFYATMVFGLVYFSVYHVFGWGLNQDDEYQQEMLVAEKERQVYLASQANNVDENTVEIDNSAEILAEGKAVFNQNCVACHGALGEGGIGPNLTDAYWLHGGSIKAVFKTIKRGVPDKGMIAWEQQLSPGQIAQVANYILSLQGTTPPNAKAPQGDLDTEASVVN